MSNCCCTHSGSGVVGGARLRAQQQLPESQGDIENPADVGFIHALCLR
jgi:hypothetical protein